jgi:hypothetical protein
MSPSIFSRTRILIRKTTATREGSYLILDSTLVYIVDATRFTVGSRRDESVGCFCSRPEPGLDWCDEPQSEPQSLEFTYFLPEIAHCVQREYLIMIRAVMPCEQISHLCCSPFNSVGVSIRWCNSPRQTPEARLRLGREVFAGLLSGLRLRSDVTGLQTCHPVLCSKYTTLRNEIGSVHLTTEDRTQGELHL